MFYKLINLINLMKPPKVPKNFRFRPMTMGGKTIMPIITEPETFRQRVTRENREEVEQKRKDKKLCCTDFRMAEMLVNHSNMPIQGSAVHLAPQK